MKKILTILLVLSAGLIANAQSSKGDTMVLLHDSHVNNLSDSSQFSRYASIDSNEYSDEQPGKRKRFKRTTASSYSKSNKRSSASNRKR